MTNCRIRVLASVLVGTLLQAPLHAAILTVGSDSSCTVPDLPSAMAITNSNGTSNEIRLANNADYHFIALQKNDSQELTIRGGYADCSATAPLGVLTVLDSNGGNAPVIEATDGRLYLENLRIVGASLRGKYSSGGGVNAIERTMGVELKNVQISDNSAHQGGGFAIIGKPGHVIQMQAENLVLENNISDTNGGGMYAEYATGTFFGLRVENNHAMNNGGGMWLGQDANFDNRNGKHFSGFIENHAENSGGGLAIERGSMQMFQINRGLDPQLFAKNRARVGGGVYVFNDTPFSTSAFIASGINAYGNRASEEGGFAAVDFRAADSDPVFGGIQISADAPPVGGGGFSYCGQALSCNNFEKNEAMDDNGQQRPGALVSIRNQGKGAAGFARFWNVSVVESAGYNLASNYADVASESVKEIEFKNALIRGNILEKNLILAEGFGTIKVMGSTFTENSAQSSLISGQYEIYMRGSIFTDDLPLLETITSLTSVFTVMVRNNQGLSGFPLVFQDDPRFVDPANQDFQLQANSPAIDREWNDMFNPLDRNENPRNVDQVGVPDFNTPRDLGCFERQ